MHCVGGLYFSWGLCILLLALLRLIAYLALVVNLHYMSIVIIQVYQRTDDGPRAALYCQLTLRRQLEMKQYDPVDWSLNAATLSQYYVIKFQFYLARHCLGKLCLFLPIFLWSVLLTFYCQQLKVQVYCSAVIEKWTTLIIDVPVFCFCAYSKHETNFDELSFQFEKITFC